MKETDLRELIFESLRKLSFSYNSKAPYEYLDRVSFLELATDLSYELEQSGIILELLKENESTYTLSDGE